MLSLESSDKESGKVKKFPAKIFITHFPAKKKIIVTFHRNLKWPDKPLKNQ